MKDCSQGNKLFLSHTAQSGCIVLCRQRTMDCPFLSYRSCCSPTTSGHRPAETSSLFSLSAQYRCTYTHICDVQPIHTVQYTAYTKCITYCIVTTGLALTALLGENMFSSYILQSRLPFYRNLVFIDNECVNIFKPNIYSNL